MKTHRLISIFLLMTSTFFCSVPTTAQQKGTESITAAELKVHLNFLAADEFRGRNTPSRELKIASRYLATMVESYGFKPLMPNGSFYQEIPLDISAYSKLKTRITLKTELSEQEFFFPEAFGIKIGPGVDEKYSGEVVFCGYGLQAPDLNWDDYGDVDLKGKILIILDVKLPEDHVLRPKENRSILRGRAFMTAFKKGASAVLSVVDEERERNFAQNDYHFDNSERGIPIDKEISSTPYARKGFPLLAEIRHKVATEILNISKKELLNMFEMIRNGKQVPSKEFPGKNAEISVGSERRKGYTYNVVAYLEGSDKELKNEYVLFGSHHDHIGAREGKIYNGADDNGSGTVAMLEIAQALAIERPKRSVIMVWHTAEEKGLIGAHYFVKNSPVPVEKMSAEINLDMLCRNDPNSLYLIGSKFLSTELDAAIHTMNNNYIHMNLDYSCDGLAHPKRWFFRSDHYPYIQYGIPAVWLFCGATEDYHQETDTIDRADFSKMEKAARLAYLTAYEIGNEEGMLKLDVNPEITSRGKHNLKINWRKLSLKKQSEAR